MKNKPNGKLNNTKATSFVILVNNKKDVVLYSDGLLLIGRSRFGGRVLGNFSLDEYF